MSELLSPAGSKEAFIAAISNGADAIYLGLDKFSARAYANNFTLDELKVLVSYAHLRNVKIYVTINTIIYDHEYEEACKIIDELANMHVDAIIVQDLAILTYITNTYKSLKAHCSTQMGIDDIYGAKLAKELGATRIVPARETPLETIKEIKDKTNIEVEAFIHGALCVGYSGNCLMSSSIGERSGNRGRCAGCCRKIYSLINNNNESLEKGYLLSMKDLNSSSILNKMKFIDSFKIEGRMKEPFYVGTVTSLYKDALNNKKDHLDYLNKVFNRTYTTGLINNDKIENLTNIEKPNNYGEEIGVVDRQGSGKLWIKLFKPLSKGDQIRIETPFLKDEISLFVANLYDSSFRKNETLTKMAIVDCEQKVMGKAKVYKTKDSKFVKEFEKSLLKKEYNRFDIDFEFNGHIGKPIILKATFNKIRCVIKSEFLVEVATTCSTTKDEISNLLSRLNDTPYQLRNCLVNVDDDAFIPLKIINDMRRDIIEKINEARLNIKVELNDSPLSFIPQEVSLNKPIITVQVSNDEQYQAAKECGINDIYYKNIIRRNNSKMLDISDTILVGGLNGIEYYKDKKNYLVSDYSMNVVNTKSIALLSSLGVDRITLSHEISKDSITNLINNYVKEYHTYPSLELIVYGRTTLMHSKYCVLKRLGRCGECKTNKFALKDEFASFPLSFNDDCTMNILNSKILNNIDDINDLKGISAYRLVFTTESKTEVIKIINALKYKLANNDNTKIFNKETDTHGHFYNNPE